MVLVDNGYLSIPARPVRRLTDWQQLMSVGVNRMSTVLSVILHMKLKFEIGKNEPELPVSGVGFFRNGLRQSDFVMHAPKDNVE